MVTQKNSSDLDVGRRPKHKSDELFGVTIRVNEIISHFCAKSREITGSVIYWQRDPERLDFLARD